MSTYRELAEAEAFRRRRLAKAFSSGSYDDHTTQPDAARCVVGGLVLSGFCLLGVGVAAAVTGHVTVGWDRDGIHVSQTGPRSPHPAPGGPP